MRATFLLTIALAAIPTFATPAMVPVPAPAGLPTWELPKGSVIRFRKPITIPGGVSRARIATHDMSESQRVSCDVVVDKVLYERPLPANPWLRVVSSGKDRDEHRVEFEVVSDETQPVKSLFCDFWGGAEGQPHRHRPPSMSELSCLLSVMVYVPEGKTNPPLVCP